MHVATMRQRLSPGGGQSAPWPLERGLIWTSPLALSSLTAGDVGWIAGECLEVMSAAGPIVKSDGVNTSERRLIRIAEKTFLNLWSYPNIFVKKSEKSSFSSKEIADLLVICGDDIIVFSDKRIAYPVGEVDQSWARWYRRAVEHSASQLRKAERCIRAYPDSLYLDAKCTQPLPLALPTAEKRKIHGIVIVSGVDNACRAHFPGGTGSMMINSELKGDDHVDVSKSGYTPFSIGDVNDKGSFLHVFNDSTIEVLLNELSTVADFINYLKEREVLLRSGKWISACGEEDLLALFFDTADDSGVHSFSRDPRLSGKEFGSLIVEEGYWSSYIFSSRYFEQMESNKISYAWDQLIQLFGVHALAGTSYKIPGTTPSVVNAEKSLRTMAREPRVWRRHLARQLFETLDKAEALGMNKFFRVAFPARTIKSAEKAYVFFVLDIPADLIEAYGPDQYRHARVVMLRSYCQNLLLEYANLREVVGLGFDPKRNFSNGYGGSEDVVYAEQQVWTSEVRQRLLEERESLEIFQKSNMDRGKRSDRMYPRSDTANRHERRRRKSESRRSK